MKAKFLMVAALAVAVMTSSCSIMRSSLEQRETDVRAYEPVNYVPFTQPLAAEIKVLSEDRISDTWSFSSQTKKGAKASRKYSKNQSQDLKVEALAKSAKKHNADIIVAATFEYKRVVKVSDDKSSEQIEIVVTGYPAKFVNWRNIESKSSDYEWVKDFYGTSIGLTSQSNDASRVISAKPSEIKLVVE